MPAVKLTEKAALAAEVPDPVCHERKDAPLIATFRPPAVENSKMKRSRSQCH